MEWLEFGLKLNFKKITFEKLHFSFLFVLILFLFSLHNYISNLKKN